MYKYLNRLDNSPIKEVNTTTKNKILIIDRITGNRNRYVNN